MKPILVFIGTLIVVLSVLSAFVYEFKHFYEFLLVGLLLLLVPFAPRAVFTKKRVVKSYVLFFAAGLVVDLLIGLAIIRGWYYNYTELWEYVLLYAWVYPAGGFVLTLSYLISKRLFTTRVPERRVDVKIFWALFLLSTGSAVLLWCARDMLPFGVWNYSFGSIALLSLIAFSALRAERTHTPSWAGEALAQPLPILAATILATLMNAIIHEYPNVYAQQWVYTVTTGTFLDAPMLGIPVLLWLLWPLLTIGSATLFYRTVKTENP